jgi:serine/threonine protein kinase
MTGRGSATGAPADFDALPIGSGIGRYKVKGVLGQGGFGITYLAFDEQLGRDVAIKEYLPSFLATRRDGASVLPRSTQMADDFAWGRERFVAEARTLATLQDAPGIVRVHDFLEANGTAYMVMEWLRGRTLEAALSERGRLGPGEVVAILEPLLVGLERVHAAGFLHRDIKPANILLRADGKPTLIDFGASRTVAVGKTSSMTAVFSPGYAAPEQVTSAQQGPWTDLYALAATLYRAITGALPPAAFDRLLDDRYDALARLAPAGFEPALLAAIDAGLAVRPADRPQSIAAWRQLMRRLPSANPGDAPTVAVVPSASATGAVRSAAARDGTSRPRRVLTLIGAGAVLAIGLGAGAWFVFGSRLIEGRAAAPRSRSPACAATPRMPGAARPPRPRRGDRRSRRWTASGPSSGPRRK